MSLVLSTWSCMIAALASATCGPTDATVVYREVEHSSTWAERGTIERIAEDAIGDVRQLLPALPDQLVLRVDADDNVSDLTSSSGTFDLPNWVYWTVDPERGDVVMIAEAHLRNILFHELHHMVRDAGIPRTSFMDGVVSEGMASVFERDFGGASYPFMEYPDNALEWVAELAELPDLDYFSEDGIEQRRQYMREHPDGRRRIGYRAGTYLVDQAMHVSGLSAADLVSTPTGDILRMAGVE